MKTILAIIFLSSLTFAQSKIDSTKFKFWINEMQKSQKQIAIYDTLKIKWQGIYEYQYQNALMEKRKIDIIKAKADSTKAKKRILK